MHQFPKDWKTRALYVRPLQYTTQILMSWYIEIEEGERRRRDEREDGQRAIERREREGRRSQTDDARGKLKAMQMRIIDCG